jgi:hypothetical protein
MTNLSNCTYCMHIGATNINIDNQINTILKSRHLLIKKPNFEIELKHLRSELTL